VLYTTRIDYFAECRKHFVGINPGAKHGNISPRGLSTEAQTVCGTGPDSPRPSAGATPPLHTSGRSVPRARRSMIAHRVFFSAKNPRTHPWRDPIEGESSKGLLRVGRPPGAPLIGVESSRDCCGRLNYI
jgi:hypothetical protein